MRHRDELDAVQRELREIEGCTILVYDQTCATEKRRRRKRGKMVDPAKRVVINELVCEGCGDCSVQSNCLSVEPVETEFGRKRRINQNTCNKDYSCLKGFCPSFVTVEGGQLKKPQKQAQARRPNTLPEIPEPQLPLAENAWGIVVAGIGGTGVITIGQLLGMAAHLEGKGVITQDSAGLAQKGGATWSHIQIANRQDAIYTTKVDTAKADLVIACDGIVAAGKATLALMREGRTYVALNSHATPTAAFVGNPDWQIPQGGCEAALQAAVGRDQLGLLDADQVAVQLLGDSIYTNPLLLGYAWQKGQVPLSRAALLRAIELNGVQVDNNKAAFEWGRRCAHDLASVTRAVQGGAGDRVRQEAVARRNDGQARRVPHRLPERRLRRAVQGLRRQGARGRGAADGDQQAHRGGGALPVQADGLQGRVRGRAPAHRPGVRRRRSKACSKATTSWCTTWRRRCSRKRNAKGELVKQPFGPWMRTAFGVLAKLKGLRGTRVRPLRPHRRAQDRARADRPIQGLHRRAAARPERRAPAAGRRHRAHPRGDPRLRPREGAPPGRRARQVGGLDGALARQGFGTRRRGRAHS